MILLTCGVAFPETIDRDLDIHRIVCCCLVESVIADGAGRSVGVALDRGPGLVLFAGRPDPASGQLGLGGLEIQNIAGHSQRSEVGAAVPMCSGGDFSIHAVAQPYG